MSKDEYLDFIFRTGGDEEFNVEYANMTAEECKSEADRLGQLSNERQKEAIDLSFRAIYLDRRAREVL